ncbi:hypothetical protein B0T22DRAFT_492447 [Podospora appendiculata]|uniref:DUF7707 domain-containing protein n=1 Tax=Podospora appendiculata TaxID=314037 RepID=A0AAE0X5X8_9PEZI|nr:hypothetical protein B0T22DRAFT_492447 [Podospora appendiculata]
MFSKTTSLMGLAFAVSSVAASTCLTPHVRSGPVHGNPLWGNTICSNQITSCSVVCNSKVQENTCTSNNEGVDNPLKSITYCFSCVCADGSVPNLKPYLHTVPNTVCQRQSETCYGKPGCEVCGDINLTKPDYWPADKPWSRTDIPGSAPSTTQLPGTIISTASATTTTTSAAVSATNESSSIASSSAIESAISSTTTITSESSIASSSAILSTSSGLSFSNSTITSGTPVPTLVFSTTSSTRVATSTRLTSSIPTAAAGAVEPAFMGALGVAMAALLAL